MLFYIVSSLSVHSGSINNILVDVGNEGYWFNQSFNFSQIIINSSWLNINDTAFYIDSPNDINISIIFLNDNIANADENDEILDFYANTSVGTVYFNISGFKIGEEYSIKRDNVIFKNVTADGSGIIRFTNNIWSIKHFEILVAEEIPIGGSSSSTGGGGGLYVPPSEDETTTTEKTISTGLDKNQIYMIVFVAIISIIIIFYIKRRRD